MLGYLFKYCLRMKCKKEDENRLSDSQKSYNRAISKKQRHDYYAEVVNRKNHVQTSDA